jgi:prepilin-type N-terminal cleavage/methylation domain-containing protein
VSAPHPADERGLTLIEVLVTVSLMGFVMAALSGALFVGLRTTEDTRTSLDQSNAEQLITTYVTKDLQAATNVRTSGTSPCGGQAIVLETTTRTDPLAVSASNVTVAYSLSGTNLVRQVCGPTPSVLSLADNITSFTVSGTNPVHVTVGTAASGKVAAYSWTVEVRRRQA